jgi:hypothetical protein
MNKFISNNVWHFRTIGMGTINYRKAALRLAKEVSSTKIFESSYGLDENFIKENASSFWVKHEKILKARVPGFGWWIWKPTFIELCLNGLNENDCMLYLDAGSFLAVDEKDSILNVLENINRFSLVGSNNQTFPDWKYCSKNLLDNFEISNVDRQDNQFYANFLMIRNNSYTRQFISEWKNLLCSHDHEFLIPHSNLSQPKGFVHHMYDQAVLSCLMKREKAGIINIGDKSNPGVIRAMRHRFAYSINCKNLFVRTCFNTISFLSKVGLFFQRRIFRNWNERPPQHS